MLEILYQIGRLILVYILPFFAAYIIVKRIEERVKLRIAPYFVIAILIWVVYGVILGITHYPVPRHTGLYDLAGMMGTIPLCLVFIFIIKIKKQMGGIDRVQMVGELLKLFLLLGAVILSLAMVGYYEEIFLDIHNVVYTIKMACVVLSVPLIIYAYIEIGFIYRRFTERFWFLALLGGALLTGLLITDLAEYVAVAGSGNIEIAPTYTAIYLKYGTLCSLIGGILATIPSVVLYAKLRNRTLQTKIPSGDLRSFLEEMSKLMGGKTAIEVLRMGIAEYNLQFKRNLELTSERGIKNLRTGEGNSLAKYLVGVFSKRIGPIAYQVALKSTSLF